MGDSLLSEALLFGSPDFLSEVQMEFLRNALYFHMMYLISSPNGFYESPTSGYQKGISILMGAPSRIMARGREIAVTFILRPQYSAGVRIVRLQTSARPENAPYGI